MKTPTNPGNTLFVLFGSGGDLSWRLIVPALSTSADRPVTRDGRNWLTPTLTDT